LTRFGTVAVVGVGLIGGSIGRALRTRKLARRVIGVGRSTTNLADAIRVGAIDEPSTDLPSVIHGVDVVVVCTPVTSIVEAVRTAARHSPSDVLITDAGSTKRTIVEAIEQDAKAARLFVGAHPIAGSERQGAAFADADLFERRVCVLTPTERTPPDRLRMARSFWEGLGSRVIELDPASHDDALALTSHLPHAIAATLATTIPSEFLGLAAGAYRDGTRVAASDTALWTGIFNQNRGPLLDALSVFEGELAAFRTILEGGNVEALRAWWEAARRRRTAFNGHEQSRIEHSP
jgi:prephenate dehydrogenase